MLPYVRFAMRNTPLHISERNTPLPADVSYPDAIRLLCREATATHCPESAESAVRSALEREAQEPTYVGRGMAIPHARVEGLANACVYLAHSEAGILWPEEAAHTVVLLIVPAEQPDLYLQLLRRTVKWRMQGEPCPLAEFIGSLSQP